MGFVEVLLVGIGLSMDAMAVSVCKGLGMKRLNWGQAVVIALFFGGFQALMPVLGWLLGSAFAGFITSIDHWIAFALLAVIGGKMVWDAFHEDEEGADEIQAKDAPLDFRELVGLAVATSIDALAVGVTFAFLEVNVVFAVAIIGATTFALSMFGVGIGHLFGRRFQKLATIAGGLVLVGLGAKILIEGLLGL